MSSQGSYKWTSLIKKRKMNLSNISMKQWIFCAAVCRFHKTHYLLGNVLSASSNLDALSVDVFERLRDIDEDSRMIGRLLIWSSQK